MELETVLVAAIQSSFMLGLIHGVNPCGHSWLVLAPFVTGEKKGKNVALYTIAFLAGTALACLVLGVSLGAISVLIPMSAGVWVEGLTSLLLLIIGLLLVYKPNLLHSHDHYDHDHDHRHHHGGSFCIKDAHAHHESGIMQSIKGVLKNQKSLPLMLFVIGFVNMIVPCPTAAVMYGYARDRSASSE